MALKQHAIDPRTKIDIVSGFFVAAIGVHTWYGMGIIFSSLVLWQTTSSVTPRAVLQAVRSVRWLLLFTLIFHAFSGTATPLYKLGPLTITIDGVQNGVWLTVRFLAMIIAATILTKDTSPLKLAQGLDALLSPLQKLGIPTRQFIMMFSISLRFLPILSEEAQRIQEAQALRGLNDGNKSVTDRLRFLVPLLIPLLGSALRRA